MAFIYHLTTPQAWQDALALGEYRAGSLATEGFIHASTANQFEASANRHFAQHAGILLLKIDLNLVKPRVVWEESPHSATPFPHLYGPLNLDAVIAVHSWTRDSDGYFRAPSSL